MTTWQHAANEWADATCNALQGVRNIRDGIATHDEVIADLERQIAHCRESDNLATQAGAAEEREVCASALNISRSEASLMAGEMTAQEWRTVAAILKALQIRICKPNSTTQLIGHS